MFAIFLSVAGFLFGSGKNKPDPTTAYNQMVKINIFLYWSYDKWAYFLLNMSLNYFEYCFHNPGLACWALMQLWGPPQAWWCCRRCCWCWWCCRRSCWCWYCCRWSCCCPRIRPPPRTWPNWCGGAEVAEHPGHSKNTVWKIKSWARHNF